VLRLVLRQGMTWAAGGTLAGLAGALAAAKLLAAALFDVQPRDPVTFAAAGAAVMLVALSACVVPAVRAVNIDPTIAMRTE
jgi:putative ABC transport system permease protein